MRILFIPCSLGGFSHQIPLYVLSKRIQHLNYEMAFLLQQKDHETFRRNNIPVLPMDFKGSLSEELAAYNHFQPDLVVDDLSANTVFVKQLHPVQRIAIQRTGIFEPEKGIKNKYKHSGNAMPAMPDVTELGLKNIDNFSDFFKGDLHIIPGIRSIEVLPKHLQDDPQYYFSGPLNMEDYLSDDLRQDLEAFYERNDARIKVYFTFGLIAKASQAIVNCIKFLLQNQIAVVTNIRLDHLDENLKERYYFSSFLPINFICDHSDLVIHHCGSGMYHYPILNEKPTITIGTMCYDREDVALQLQRLGVSHHLPSPLEIGDFELQFKTLFKTYLDNPESFCDHKKLSELKDEIHQTMLDFSFGDVIEQAMQFSKKS